MEGSNTEVDPAALAPRESFEVGVPPFLTGQPLLAVFAGALVASLGALPVMGPSAIVFVLGALFVGFLLTTIPARLVVGSDGIAVTWLWRRLFVPYSAIGAESRALNGVFVEVLGGRSLELRTDAPERLLSLLRTRKGFAYSVQGMLTEEALANDKSLLAPSGKIEEWALRLRGMSDADYRSVSMPRDRLLAVVGAPHVAPELRAAAAFVLGKPVGDEEADVLRRAQQSTASRTLERALTRAQSDDPAERTRGLRTVLAASRREDEDRRRGSAPPTT